MSRKRCRPEETIDRPCEADVLLSRGARPPEAGQSGLLVDDAGQRVDCFESIGGTATDYAASNAPFSYGGNGAGQR